MGGPPLPQARAAIGRPSGQRRRIGIAVPGVGSIGRHRVLDVRQLRQHRRPVLRDLVPMTASATDPIGDRARDKHGRPERRQ